MQSIEEVGRQIRFLPRFSRSRHVERDILTSALAIALASANSQLWQFLKKRSRCTRSQVGFSYRVDH